MIRGCPSARVAAALGIVAVMALASACGPAVPGPAALDTTNEACASCRMGVIDRRFAAQLVAPGEEPKFFDDIGCLRDYITRTERIPRNAIAYVSDHRTREWVAAAQAVYSRAPGVQTPMDSAMIAHRDRVSRDMDPAAMDAEPLSTAEVFGPRGAPDGTR